MPYVLPRTLSESDRLALVLAFGNLSALETCSVMRGGLSEVTQESDRILTATASAATRKHLPELAGIHKAAASNMMQTPADGDIGRLVESVVDKIEVNNFSVSGYDLNAEDYEEIVRGILDALRDSGVRKARLLRPEGQELRADIVVSRKAVDFVAFPHGKGISLGLTYFVQQGGLMRERGVRKPVPHSEISMSPRLAKLLLNLAGARPGQSVLDPFCGSGTILSEALLSQLHVVGLDADPRMVRDAKRNLHWAVNQGKTGTFRLGVGDARELPMLVGERRFEAVVSEPLLLPPLRARPKSETAQSIMEAAGSVYDASLAAMAQVLAPGGRIVLVVPLVRTIEGETASIELDGAPLGLKQHQPGPIRFEYPVRMSFESTRWIQRAVYVFESRA